MELVTSLSHPWQMAESTLQKATLDGTTTLLEAQSRLKRFALPFLFSPILNGIIRNSMRGDEGKSDLDKKALEEVLNTLIPFLWLPLL